MEVQMLIKIDEDVVLICRCWAETRREEVSAALQAGGDRCLVELWSGLIDEFGVASLITTLISAHV